MRSAKRTPSGAALTTHEIDGVECGSIVDQEGNVTKVVHCAKCDYKFPEDTEFECPF